MKAIQTLPDLCHGQRFILAAAASNGCDLPGRRIYPHGFFLPRFKLGGQNIVAVRGGNCGHFFFRGAFRFQDNNRLAQTDPRVVLNFSESRIDCLLPGGNLSGHPDRSHCVPGNLKIIFCSRLKISHADKMTGRLPVVRGRSLTDACASAIFNNPNFFLGSDPIDRKPAVRNIAETGRQNHHPVRTRPGKQAGHIFGQGSCQRGCSD